MWRYNIVIIASINLSSFLKERRKSSYRHPLAVPFCRHHGVAIIRWHFPLSRCIHLATAALLKNIVKTALKYYTVSHRKNCRAVDGNLPLSPRASDDSYCSHEGNTSMVTLNSTAGGIPFRNIAAIPYCRCISVHCINQPCWIRYTFVSDHVNNGMPFLSSNFCLSDSFCEVSNVLEICSYGLCSPFPSKKLISEILPLSFFSIVGLQLCMSQLWWLFQIMIAWLSFQRLETPLNVTIIIRCTVVILGKVPMDAHGTLHSRCYRFIILTDVLSQQESLGIKSNH